MFKRALVLSGGGSKGAFQVGALSYLLDRGVEFDTIAGVSVGSLNGAMLAQNSMDALISVWRKLEQKQVYVKPSVLSIIYRNLLGGKKSLYDATPLRELISEHIDLSKISVPFYLGLTSLKTGKYHSLLHEDFSDNKDFGDAIYASSLMPILWEPVDVNTKSGLIEQAVDGGVRNVTPLSDVLGSLPDHIYIISCNDGSVVDKKAKSILDVASRTFLDIMLNEVMDNDISELLKINDLVIQAKRNGYVLLNPKSGKTYKHFGVTIIRPPYKLSGPTDFNRTRMEANITLGYETAKVNI